MNGFGHLNYLKNCLSTLKQARCLKSTRIKININGSYEENITAFHRYSPNSNIYTACPAYILLRIWPTNAFTPFSVHQRIERSNVIPTLKRCLLFVLIQALHTLRLFSALCCDIADLTQFALLYGYI